MKRMTTSVYRTLAVLAIVGVVVASPAGADGRHRVGDQADGTAAWLADPLSHPAGVDPGRCRASSAHPRPVLLLPGTFVRVSQGFAALGPVLANRGYCVYGVNYGDTVLSTLTGGRVGAVGDIVASARQLAAAIRRVRAVTGASQVDLVGWSEGGLVAREYLKTSGARYVARLVELSTPNHGTDFAGVYGILRATGLVSVLGSLETAGHVSALALLGCDACDQQLVGSAFLTSLDHGGDTVAGVAYTVLSTERGVVNTPSSTQALRGRRVRNVSLQTACPRDSADDLGIVYDPVALQYVLQGLADSAPGRVDCSATLDGI